MVHVALDAQEKPTDLVKQEYPKNLVEKVWVLDNEIWFGCGLVHMYGA